MITCSNGGYEIPAKFIFEGVFRIKADSICDAVDAFDRHCSMNMGQIHTTLNEEDVNWDFSCTPKKVIPND